MNKKFTDNLGVYCCPHVFEERREVRLVIRDPDGDWQFLCGQNDDTEDCHHIGVGHLTCKDGSLHDMTMLKPSTGAERISVDSEWTFFNLD